MFGTIILDSYTWDEIELMANNLDEICSPTDTLGWASAGIYSFWDYYTKEILYIGLASDTQEHIPQRRQVCSVACRD